MHKNSSELSRSDGLMAGLSAALADRDAGTQMHCSRVAAICRRLGVEFGLSGDEQHILDLAATFHDVGKIAIPDEVLLKRGPLTSEEWTVMRTHSAIGEKIVLATQAPLAAPIALVVRHHHEAFNGRGYPDGLEGDEIPLLSRILAVADAYDAMASSRPYREGLPRSDIEQVLLEGKGAQFDPFVTVMMLEILKG